MTAEQLKTLFDAENEKYQTSKIESEKESPGHIAEGLVLEFIMESNLGFSDIERTSTFDINDKNGIDAVGKITGDGEVAIDITFNDDPEKLKEKMQRNLRNPCVCLHDEKGRVISAALPRILIRDISSGNWILYSKEAEARGGALTDAMENSFKIKK